PRRTSSSSLSHPNRTGAPHSGRPANWPGGLFLRLARNRLLSWRGPFLPPHLGLPRLAPLLVQLDDPVEGLADRLGGRVFRLGQARAAGQEERLGLGVLLLPGQAAAEQTAGGGGLPVARRVFLVPDGQALAQQGL